MTTTATEVKEEVSTTRIITVVTSLGEKRKIPFSGIEFSELKTLLRNGGTDVEGKAFSGYNLSNLKMVESTNRHTLESDKAIIPTVDFNLFLMPVKSKGGVNSSERTEIYASIKALAEEDAEAVKAHFGKWTNQSTSSLKELLESYKGYNKTKVTEKVKQTKTKANKEKAEAISDVIESVKIDKAKGGEGNLYEELTRMSTTDQLFLVIKLLTEIKESISGKVVSEPTAPVKTEAEIAAEKKVEEDRIAAETKKKAEDEAAAEKKKKEDEEKAEKKRLDDEETARLLAEMDDAMEGMDDVRR